ncbi:MAG: D-glycerate dehydrogenase [Betaproteobacteria bacterium]|nr:D-glycerate dehydrogenase [Betaproteobacteria bacterium]NBT74805.1 D-glycerate dehydrogenase [Betaproteobacteria bacterium]NBY13636.1 D-glycerate dehydrogenase [Betaproteobacteria bacterium]NCA15865.1 D-glycerate dehydrogenase [Betaproteobacteria bacterium]
MTKPHLLVTRRIYSDALERLGSVFTISHNQELDTPTQKDELLAKIVNADYLFCTVADRIDADVIAAAPRLRLVATGAVGTNNIDLAACRARGIPVTNTPDVLTETTADFGWALLMATARRVSESERYVRSGQWTGWSFDQFNGVDVFGATLGIVGMGRIGSAIARRAQGFRMRVIYHNRRPSDATDAQWVDKPTLFRESDFVMLVVPYSPETHHLVSAAELALMKPTACLINIARGGVVNDADLVSALSANKIRAAGLDVFEGEPKLDARLLGFQNVVLTPHIASSSGATRGRMVSLAADNLIAHAQGRPLLTPV